MTDYYTKIVLLSDKTPRQYGGGRGQRASITLDDGTVIEGRGIDKATAMMSLYAEVEKVFPPSVALPDFSAKRVESEVKAAKAVGRKGESLLRNGHADGVHDGVTVPGCPDCVPEPTEGISEAREAPEGPEAPQPAKKPRGDRPKSHRACDVSCVFAHNDVDDCVCQCTGVNHGLGWSLFLGDKVGRTKVAKIAESLDGPARVKDGRDCACGCGERTKGGRFLQGHDRKLHSKLAGVIEGPGYFKEEDGVGLVLTPLGRKAAKEARRG